MQALENEIDQQLLIAEKKAREEVSISGTYFDFLKFPHGLIKEILALL